MHRSDDSCWPLLIVRVHSGLRSWLQTLRDAAERGRYGLLLDMTHAPSMPSLGTLTAAARESDDLLDTLCGVAVITRSPLLRNSLVPLYSTVQMAGHRVFEDDDAAIAWCQASLRRSDLHPIPSTREVRQRLDRLRGLDGPPTGVRAEPPPPPLLSDELPAILELLDRAAYVVDASGRLRFANAAGRSTPHEEPWFRAVLAEQDSNARSPTAHVVPLTPGREYLVVPVRPWEIPEQFDALSNTWPPRLRQTARLLLEGLTDKELAERLGVRPSTARTYVVRVFRRLGVHSRAQLLAGKPMLQATLSGSAG